MRILAKVGEGFGKVACKMRAFSNIAERFGFPRAMASCFLWLLRRAITYRRCIVFYLRTTSCLDEGKSKDIVFGFGSVKVPPDSQQWSESGLTSFTPPRGARFFCGRLSNMLVFMSLVRGDAFLITERFRVSLPRSWAYVGNIVTEPAYRRRGIFGAALLALCGELRKEGVDYLCFYVESENYASLRGVTKAGFIPFASAKVLGIGRFRRVSWRWLKKDAALKDLKIQPLRDRETAADHGSSLGQQIKKQEEL